MNKMLLLGSSIIRRFHYIEPGWTVTNLGIERLLTTYLSSDEYANMVLNGMIFPVNEIGGKLSFQEDNEFRRTELSLQPSYHSMIFYCGNNDLKRGISADIVINNICLFLQQFHEYFSQTHIFVLSILYSPKNHILQLFPQIEYINSQLKTIVANHNNFFHFIELHHNISDNMYYENDSVHLNKHGYEILQQIILNRDYTDRKYSV